MKTKYLSLISLLTITFFNLHAQDKPFDVAFHITGEKLEITIDGLTSEGINYEVEISKNGKDYISLGNLQSEVNWANIDLSNSREGINYIRIKATDLKEQSSTSKVKALLLDNPVFEVNMKLKHANPQIYI
ncbi:MAG: hypothetical protein AAGI07_05935 [Bacteroidota bacterium]